MLTRTVTIVNKLGLHARAAAKLVNESGKFESRVVIQNSNHQADAKSIMGVMMLAASQGTQLELSTDGPDEQEALDAIVDLIEGCFGEPD